MRAAQRGTPGGAPFHLTAFVNGEDVTAHLDLPALLLRYR